MAKHAPDDRLTTAQRSGLDDDPLGMGCWLGIGEAADLRLLGVHQPTHAIFRRVPVDEWLVLVRHLDTMAKRPCECWAN